MSDNGTICKMMWDHLYTAPDSKIWPCCKFARTNDDRKTVHQFDSLNDAINDPFLVDIRNKAIAGIKIDGCIRCYIDEKAGGESMRTNFNNSLDVNTDSAYISAPYNPSFIFPFISNMCNSACRSCNPSLSNRIAKEILVDHAKTEVPHKFYGFSADVFNGNPTRSTGIIDLLLEQKLLDACSRFRCAGGEPFLTPGFFQAVDYMIKNDLAKNIKLDVTTNFSVKTVNGINVIDYISMCINHFKHVDITISIDSYDKAKFEYMRSGCSFDLVMSNMSRLENLKHHTNLSIKVTSVISVFNVIDAYSIFNSRFKSFCDTYTEFLHAPNYLNIGILSDVFHPNYESIHLTNLTRGFMDQNRTPELIQMFVENTDYIDNIRNESWRDTFPELYSILSDNINIKS